MTAGGGAAASQAQLAAAIDQVAESIVVTDLEGLVLYANPAFGRTSGCPVSELIGRPASAAFKGSGATSAYPRMRRRLRSGRTWSGEWDLERLDGSTCREEVTISPIRDLDGQVVSFVRVARDVTHLRQVQASLDLATRERLAFAHALARLEQRDTPEDTAQEITDAAADLPGVDIAALTSFSEHDDVRVLAVTATHDHPFLVVGQSLSPDTGARFRELASLGAWTERRQDDVVEGPFAAFWDLLRIRAVAYAPIGSNDGPIGLLILGTTDEPTARRIEDQLPAAIEFAAAARSLIAAAMVSRRHERAGRQRIGAIIATGGFEPVFQPVVHLKTGAAIGYEGLTRFKDGTRPDVVFEEAGRVGLGTELEVATLGRIVEAARELPDDAWLALNVSAALVLDGDCLGRILEHRTRPIVLEITEHDVIDDYAAVRAAIALLGPDVRAAVDDAGAGVANFNHIVELRPDFVKIDVSLVRGVDHDLHRQALIIGLRHFAHAISGWLIAEGVETEAERLTLIELGLERGQGYLFGRPADVASWARSP